MNRDLRGAGDRYQVVAVGTGGGRMVQCLRADPLFASDDRADVRFTIVHTDVAVLELAEADKQIHVQRAYPTRLGLPRDESRWRDELDREIRSADLVFVVIEAAEVAATEIAAVVSRIARGNRRSLTLAFALVRSTGGGLLEEGEIARLLEAADSTFLVPVGASPEDGERQIRQAMSALMQIARQPGLINYSLREISETLRDAGLSELAFGRGGGDDPFAEAARLAFACPTLFRPLREASACFLHARTPPGASLFDLSRLGQSVAGACDPEANLWLTAYSDPTLDGEIEVTLFAAGLPAD